MKHLVLLSLCCCLFFACKKNNSNIAVCNNIPFNEMSSKYFSQNIITDSLLPLHFEAWSRKWWSDIKDDSLYNFAIKYCPEHYQGNYWQSNAVVLYKRYRLLWFQGLDETDTHQYVFSRFLLCDTCGEILDSLCIRTYDGGATYDKAFDHENFSDFYVDKNSLVWLYYKSFYDLDTVTCMKTVYDITKTKIQQKEEIQEYKLTHQDYLKGWQGWK